MMAPCKLINQKKHEMLHDWADRDFTTTTKIQQI
jgi:hypothetical protein